jgi:two-component system phosphate regulon sensor histidine kinase PhoR
MPRDLWRLTGILILAGIIGLAMGQVTLCLTLTLLAYALWQHNNLYQLLQWIRRRKEIEAPDAPGIYEAICREIDFLRTRHKKRKKKLGDYLHQFRQATAALPDAALVLGPQGEIQWANEAAGDYLGVHWPQDYRQRLTNLVRNPELPKFLRNQKDHPNSSIEIPSPVKPGCYLSITVGPFGEDQQLFVARDVTRLHRLNQIRSDFVANVSHELRTPVTVVSGYLETLAGDTDHCPPEWRPILEQMQHQTNRMRNVIEELLLLSRLEQDEKIAKPEIVDVPEMINNIYKDAQALYGPDRHLFYLEVDPKLLLIGARGELYSAFSNLIMNAIRYTPANGVIRIRWYQDPAGIHFAVSDTGIGIPEYHIPRLTERFYRVDQSRSRESGGTGLGLAIVKHVLIRHKAKLHIESEIGQGSTFRCDFPPDLIVASDPDAEMNHQRLST